MWSVDVVCVASQLWKYIPIGKQHITKLRSTCGAVGRARQESEPTLLPWKANRSVRCVCVCSSDGK